MGEVTDAKPSAVGLYRNPRLCYGIVGDFNLQPLKLTRPKEAVFATILSPSAVAARHTRPLRTAWLFFALTGVSVACSSAQKPYPSELVPSDPKPRVCWHH